MKVSLLEKEIRSKDFANRLSEVYGDKAKKERERILALAESFSREFAEAEEAFVFSAPGRTELGGNHTDHQLGKVLAAAVSLDTLAIAAPNGKNVVRVISRGMRPSIVDISTLEPSVDEQGSSDALIRGILKAFADRGFAVGGFDAVTVSELMPGSGLSTSAAFEVLIGNVVNSFFADEKVDCGDIARIGQYAENEYFKKPCGLMDQLACSTGGAVSIDFHDAEKPRISRIDIDFEKNGYALFITNAGGSHADLTADYSAIPAEMAGVAEFFGERYLSRVDERQFYSKIGELRKSVSDRAITRAMHFFEESARAADEADALKNGDIPRFLRLVNESGRSSFMKLQNVFPEDKDERSISLGLALSEKLLAGDGACRVHGGGFAGTLQAFVPLAKAEEYRKKMDAAFGEGSCMRVSVRPFGGIKLI